MANDPVERPLGASAEQPRTPQQQAAFEAFQEALANLKEYAQQVGLEMDEELWAVFDTLFPQHAPN